MIDAALLKVFDSPAMRRVADIRDVLSLAAARLWPLEIVPLLLDELFDEVLADLLPDGRGDATRDTPP